MFVWLPVCSPSTCRCPARPEEGVGTLEAGGISVCEQPTKVLGTKDGPLGEQQALLITESSLQAILFLWFYVCVCVFARASAHVCVYVCIGAGVLCTCVCRSLWGQKKALISQNWSYS